MKTITLSTLFLLMTTALVCAQNIINKGTITIGGSASVTYQKEDGSDANDFSLGISPSAGYFVADNFAIGASLPFYYSKTNYKGNQIDPSATTIGIGPFVRYYIPISRVYILTEAEFVLAKGNQKSSYFNPGTGSILPYESNVTQSQYRLAAGVAVFLNQHISVDILANYSHRTYDIDVPEDGFQGDSTTKTTYIYLSVGFKLFLSKKSAD